MEKFLQIAPHSLAIVLSPVGEASGSPQPTPPAPPQQLARHHIGYEIFADFKAENMQHFWNKKVTAAVAETFFLGWIDEQVLLIQGKEEHLEALREGWTRRALRPPSGFQIRCLGESRVPKPAPFAPRLFAPCQHSRARTPGGFAPCLTSGNPHKAALPGGAVPGGDCQVRGARARRRRCRCGRLAGCREGAFLLSEGPDLVGRTTETCRETTPERSGPGSGARFPKTRRPVRSASLRDPCARPLDTLVSAAASQGS